VDSASLINRKKTRQTPPKRKRRAIGRPSSDQEGVGRDALVEKTCELLRQLPPEKVTRAEVARFTGVDPSLIRYYFQDRSTLLVAAAERLTAQFAANLEKAVKESDSSPRSLLRARVQTLFDLIVEHPYFHRLLLEEVLPSNTPAAKKMMEEMTHRTVTSYETILSAGAKQGSLRSTNPVMLLLAVIGMCEFFIGGLPIMAVGMGKKIDEKTAARDYREFIWDLLLNGIGGKSR
jgi:TetR/AcrR family transcriptional regulator